MKMLQTKNTIICDKCNPYISKTKDMNHLMNS